MKKYLGYAIVSFLIAGSTAYANERSIDDLFPTYDFALSEQEMQVAPSFEKPSDQAVTYRKEVLSICEHYAPMLAEAGFHHLAAQCDKASLSRRSGYKYLEFIANVEVAQTNKNIKELLNNLDSEISESLSKLSEKNLTPVESGLPEINNLILKNSIKK